uniref:NADH-ubiquinone oxidoreductase chain 6 n=1 Tax=Trigonopterus tanimbarensis TaxID=2678946 RepID=A0A7H1KHS4_9CUCU|nr:NADH dehydrogenase subunit 6 [Trigonopterus tanimbarensis]QNT26840.1 NADH dehydrogenase subunit 6 [Trigonopterus tanimbarensis]
MLTLIYFLSLTCSFSFMLMNHPLSLGSILLMQTILMALASGTFYQNFWFGYILFLVMIGGMLVMFIYMTSIASNEKFKMPKTSLYFYALSLILLAMIFVMDNFLSYQMNSTATAIMHDLNLNNLTLSKFYNYPNMQIMVTLMIYLLVSLIAVVKITDKPQKPLRQK